MTTTQPTFCGASASSNDLMLPQRSGLGLKSPHYQHIIDTRPDLGFFEVHAENYLVDGGAFHHFLTRIRELYPLSIHGVGLSIGSAQPLDQDHLKKLDRLLRRYQPQSFSEHLAWSSHNDQFLNDLLPMPYNTAMLQQVCEHVDQVQSQFKRQILLENPATYIEFVDSSLPETSFIQEIVRRTGCGLLLDVNNIYVSCINHHRDPHSYLRALPLSDVGEIHLAGFAQERDAAGDPLLIDSHGSPIAQAVWDLYAEALSLIGPIATLIERDNDIPPFDVLLAEAHAADNYLRLASPTLKEMQA